MFMYKFLNHSLIGHEDKRPCQLFIIQIGFLPEYGTPGMEYKIQNLEQYGLLNEKTRWWDKKVT